MKPLNWRELPLQRSDTAMTSEHLVLWTMRPQPLRLQKNLNLNLTAFSAPLSWGHRAEISQRRVKPPVIVKLKPIDHLVLCLTACGKLHAAQPLDLQLTEERFRSIGVVRNAVGRNR